jgi:hypothetical protein
MGWMVLAVHQTFSVRNNIKQGKKITTSAWIVPSCGFKAPGETGSGGCLKQAAVYVGTLIHSPSWKVVSLRDIIGRGPKTVTAGGEQNVCVAIGPPRNASE